MSCPKFVLVSLGIRCSRLRQNTGTREEACLSEHHSQGICASVLASKEMSNPKHSAEQNSLLHKRYYKGACQRTWMWLVLYFVMLCSKLPLVVSSSRGSVCTGPSLFLIRASPVPSRGCTCYNALCYQPIGSFSTQVLSRGLQRLDSYSFPFLLFRVLNFIFDDLYP